MALSKSVTNAKTPNQVAKANRKASGSTRAERKAAVKSVARSAAKNSIGQAIAAKDGKGFASGAGQASYRASQANVAAQAKADKLGVKPSKINKAAIRATKAVSKRFSQAAKAQGVKKK